MARFSKWAIPESIVQLYGSWILIRMFGVNYSFREFQLSLITG